jgi:short-subunit dehydrogenase
MDITNTNESINCLNKLIKEMNGVDLIIISSGIGHINKDLEWQLEQETINTNVLGVTAIINTSIKYFMDKKSGHLAVITSIAALRGSAECPAYNASKAFLSNYLEGLRCKVKKQNLDITITEIKPGLVDTAMAKGDGLFWVMPLEKVATQIYSSIRKRKDKFCVTKRWKAVAFIIKRIPSFIYYKM